MLHPRSVKMAGSLTSPPNDASSDRLAPGPSIIREVSAAASVRMCVCENEKRKYLYADAGADQTTMPLPHSFPPHSSRGKGVGGRIGGNRTDLLK